VNKKAERVIYPETFLSWKQFSYDHLTADHLDFIDDHKHITAKRCADPGKTVIKRETLVVLLNLVMLEKGLDLDTYEVCFRTLAQYVLIFSARFPDTRLTLSSPSRVNYLLVENGAAARVCDFVLSNLDLTERVRHMAARALTRGRIAAKSK
jgi:hypothetical protein